MLIAREETGHAAAHDRGQLVDFRVQEIGQDVVEYAAEQQHDDGEDQQIP